MADAFWRMGNLRRESSCLQRQYKSVALKCQRRVWEYVVSVGVEQYYWLFHLRAGVRIDWPAEADRCLRAIHFSLRSTLQKLPRLRNSKSTPMDSLDLSLYGSVDFHRLGNSNHQVLSCHSQVLKSRVLESSARIFCMRQDLKTPIVTCCLV